jgi:uncharacterized protein (DUF2461 family)
MPAVPSPFTAKTLAFLRALKRNNDREWFRARKDDYDRHVRGPITELISRLAVDLQSFAPELVAHKTNAAAVFPPKNFPKHEGAGLYFEIAPGWAWMGGGLYMPSSTALHAIREHIAATHPKLHRIANAASFKAVLGELHGERLTRVPRGYQKDHPAAHYLQFKQFLGFREFKPEFATSVDFYPELLRTFRAMTPLIRFLNGASVAAPKATFTSVPSMTRRLPV